MHFYYGKTVLVTGATGLIGTHLVNALMRMGDVNVIALSRSEKKLKEAFKCYLNKANFKIVAQNITATLNLTDVIDIIFHAAGPMEGKIIKNFPMDIICPNIIGLMNCLDYARRQETTIGIKARIVVFSSVTVYGNNQDTDITVTEHDTGVTDLLESINAPYSQSKRMAEVIASAYFRQYNTDIIIGRFSTVYGNVKFIPETAFYEFIKNGISRENIVLNNSNLPRRDNIYIDDAIKGVLLIGAKGKSGEAYNISSNGDGGNYASVDEIANVIVDITNKLDKKKYIEVIFKSPQIGKRLPGLKMDNRKLKELGWSIEMDLYNGIEETIKFMS